MSTLLFCTCTLATRVATVLELWQIAWGAASDRPEEVIWGIVGLLLEAILRRATRQWQRRAFRAAGMVIALADAVRLVWQGGPWWAWVAAAGGLIIAGISTGFCQERRKRTR